MDLTNKIVLVTGASRGLGKNMALRLATYGADVIFTYRSGKKAADKVAAEIQGIGQRAVALYLDLADHHSFDPFLQQVLKALSDQWDTGKFDFLINNAGMAGRSPIDETNEEMFDQLFNVHYKGVYFLTQKALPMMNDGGRIINISSGLTRFTLPGQSAYASMKGAVEVFTRYLAKELGDRGITANSVAPGAIETNFTKSAFDANPQIREMITSQTALGRVGMPDDIGGVVAFLCSEHGRWVNGQRIEASGGVFL